MSLTTDHVNQTAIRHAREAARLLDDLARHAADLSKQILKSPKSGYNAAGLTQEVSDIQWRLAKADALVALTEIES